MTLLRSLTADLVFWALIAYATAASEMPVFGQEQCYTDQWGNRICPQQIQDAQGWSSAPQARPGVEYQVDPNATWPDDRIVKLNGSYTGSLIEIDGETFILTCAHSGQRSNLSVGQEVAFQLNNHRGNGAKAVYVDAANDYAILQPNVPIRTVTRRYAVAPEVPGSGSPVAMKGFPITLNGHLRERQSVITGQVGGRIRYGLASPTATTFVIECSGSGISGESGSPLLNESEEIVGVFYGTSDAGTSMCCPVSAINTGIEYVRLNCCGRRVQAIVTPTQPRPQPQPQPASYTDPQWVEWRKQIEVSIESARCKCGDQDYASKADITAAVEAVELKPGPPGKNAEIDYSQLVIDYSQVQIDYDKLGKAIADNVDLPKPVESEKHIVIVADRNKSWWPRLAEDIEKTKDTYVGIRVAPVPENYAGEIPTAVVYEDSVPVRVVPGERDVLDLLSRVRRGMSI